MLGDVFWQKWFLAWLWRRLLIRTRRQFLAGLGRCLLARHGRRLLVRPSRRFLAGLGSWLLTKLRRWFPARLG
jgi:hypothetical protein